MDESTPAATALEFKVEGNKLYQVGDYHKAIFQFSKGLQVKDDETEHILYSNRSACYCLLEDFERALEDAESVIRLKPAWPKGYTRKAAALQSLKRLDEATAAYTKALELEPGSEVAAKGLEDIEILRKRQSKRFATELKPMTKVNLKTALDQLEQLQDVRWHVEILKDRIWLADPPLTPFRPRSMFIIDVDRKQLLSMTAHPVRDSITLDQLVDFIVSTFLNSGIYPGYLEFSDFTLMSVLQTTFEPFNIQFSCGPMEEEKQTFFSQRIEDFEVKEREQWEGNAKFAGVLRQRQQKGLSTIPGVTCDFLRHLLAAAALFWRSKPYIYFKKAVGITTQDGTTKVAIVSRNSLGQCSVALSTVQAAQSPLDCGTQSYIFADPSFVPFDDADLIERYGWEIADDKYPLAAIHNADSEVDRPSLEDFQWYELIFHVLTAFIQETFAMPTFEAPAELSSHVVVHTSQGRQAVQVTVPPRELTAADVRPAGKVIEEARMPSPRQRMLHESPQGARPASQAAGDRSKPRSDSKPVNTAKPVSKPGVSLKGQGRRPSPEQPSTTPAPPQKAPEAPLPAPSARPAPAPGASAPTTDVLALQRQVREHEQTIQSLTAQASEYRNEVEVCQKHTAAQQQLIMQLQARLKTLEESNQRLHKEATARDSMEAGKAYELLSKVASQSESLLKGINVVQSTIREQATTLLQQPPRAVDVTSTEDSPTRSQDHARSASVERSHTPQLKRRPAPTAMPVPVHPQAVPTLKATSQLKPPTVEPVSNSGSTSSRSDGRVKQTGMKAAVDSHPSPSRRQRRSVSAVSKGSDNTPTVSDFVPRQSKVQDSSFISGDWYGRSRPVEARPQDLTLSEYLSEWNMVF
mmetsp:Transcript_53293/g.95116  ORF Transcript_53293/g.95116 Transcript_53293/m.95116 type:complete len:864 (-) Transcript_53293:1743-4334(-)